MEMLTSIGSLLNGKGIGEEQLGNRPEKQVTSEVRSCGLRDLEKGGANVARSHWWLHIHIIQAAISPNEPAFVVKMGQKGLNQSSIKI